jgi:hypothetical protein
MKNVLVVVGTAVISCAAGAAMAQKVHDWRDLDAVRAHIHVAFVELQNFRAANHFDMAGHGAKAQDLLQAAEAETQLAVDAIRAGK